MCASSGKSTDAWIVDSSWSYHILSHQEWFTTFRPANIGFVYMGNDNPFGVVGIGQIKILAEDGGMCTLDKS